MSQTTASTPPPSRALAVASLVARVALAGVFLLAAYHKLVPKNGPQNFSAAVRAFEVVETGTPAADWFVRLATSVTPWVETIAAFCVLLGFWTRAGAVVLAGLLVMFIGLIASALARDLNIECGCFGDLSPFCPKGLSWCNGIQNAVLLGLAMLIALTPRHVLALENALPAPRSDPA